MYKTTDTAVKTDDKLGEAGKMEREKENKVYLKTGKDISVKVMLSTTLTLECSDV